MDAWSVKLPLPLEIIIDICTEDTDSIKALVYSKLGQDPRLLKLIKDKYEEKHYVILTCKKFNELNNFLDVLIRYVYDTTEITTVEYDGETYYNDKNNGYDFYTQKNDNIKYNIEYYSDLCQPDYYEPHDQPQHDLYHYIADNVKDPDKTIIRLSSSIKTICLNNTSGYNYDPRGGDRVAIPLDFHDYYEVKNNCLLSAFFAACYRIKSHKFDFWYELYCGVDKTDIKKDGKLMVNITFDHGS